MELSHIPEHTGEAGWRTPLAAPSRAVGMSLAEKYQHKLDLLDMVKKYSKDYIEIIRASNTDTELKNSLITLIQVISD